MLKLVELKALTTAFFAALVALATVFAAMICLDSIGLLGNALGLYELSAG